MCVVQGGEDQWKRAHYPNEDSNTSVTDHAADGEDSNTGRHKQKCSPLFDFFSKSYLYFFNCIGFG